MDSYEHYRWGKKKEKIGVGARKKGYQRGVLI